MAFMFVPNGVHIQEWKPEVTGAHYDLPRILKPLSPVKRDLCVLSGLTQDKGRADADQDDFLAIRSRKPRGQRANDDCVVTRQEEGDHQHLAEGREGRRP